MMILHVYEDGNDDAQRMLDQHAATETFDENLTLFVYDNKTATSYEDRTSRLFTNIYTHARNHARTVAHCPTHKHTHVTFITVYLQYRYIHALTQT